MKNTIRQIYFYAATLVFLLMGVIALISLLNLGMKTYLFPKADFPYGGCDSPYPMPVPGGDAKVPGKEDPAVQQALCEKNQAAQREAQRQNTLVQYLSMLIVAVPLFGLHFKWVQKEWEEAKAGGNGKNA